MKKICFLGVVLLFASLSVFAETTTRGYINSVGMWGVIDSDFNEIIPPNYLYAGEFSEGAANVKVSDGNWALVSAEDKLLVSVQAERLFALHDGWALVQLTDGDYNYINIEGKMLSKGFAYANSFSEGKAVVKNKKDNRFCYIDAKGRQLFGKLPLEAAFPFKDGFAIIGQMAPDGSVKYGLLNAKGKLAVNCVYSDISYLGEKIWAASTAEDEFAFFLINENGSRLGDIKFEVATAVNGGKVFVQLKDKPDLNYVYDIAADKLSEKPIEWELDSRKGPLYAGTNYKKYGNKCFVIDNEGKIVQNLSFKRFASEVNRILCFINGTDNVHVYVNEKGESFIPD